MFSNIAYIISCTYLLFQFTLFIKILFEGDSIELLCRAIGTDALEGIILAWNTNSLNTNASIIVTDGNFENTGLIQRLVFSTNIYYFL